MAWMALVVRLRKTWSSACGAIATGRRSGQGQPEFEFLVQRPLPMPAAQPRPLRSSGCRGPGLERQRERTGAAVRQSLPGDPLHERGRQRLGIEPDNAALPELGRRTDSGQGVADLMRYTCQQLAQSGQAFTPPQLDLQPVALGRLAAEGRASPAVRPNADDAAERRPAASG